VFSKHGKTALVLAFFILVFTACRDKGSKSISGKSRFEDTGKKALVILSVQESLYLNSDFERYLRFTIGEDFRSLPLLSLSRLLDNFIEERILLEAAKGESVSLTDEEQKAYLAKVSNEAMLKNRKIPLGEVEAELLLERLLIEKYIFEVVKDIEVEDEEIKEYYELHRREFLRPERVEVSQILLKSEERAVELLKVMKESPHFDFKTVAQKESEGVEASKGGKMGVFEMGQLPEEMEKVIFSLSPSILNMRSTPLATRWPLPWIFFASSILPFAVSVGKRLNL